MDASDELTLVYVVRPGERNERLRYSLRSVACFLPEARVVIVGNKPSWVCGVEHLYIAQPFPHRRDVVGMIRQAVDAKIADEWVLMNDDFFVLNADAPIELVYTTTLGYLTQMPGWRSGWYKRAAEHTAHLLTQLGVHDPYSFDRVHRPMPVSNGFLSSVLSDVDSDDILVRSLYGNLLGEGVPGLDAKVRGFTSPPPISGWMSVGRESWQGQAGWSMRATFSERCCFEA